MVISCGSCGSVFHFDPSLFRGSAGARLRCRRCGGSIEVRNPESIESPQKRGPAASARTDRVADPSLHPAQSAGKEKEPEKGPPPRQTVEPPSEAGKDRPGQAAVESTVPPKKVEQGEPGRLPAFLTGSPDHTTLNSVKDLKSEGLTGGLSERSGGGRYRLKNWLVTCIAFGIGALFFGMAIFGILRPRQLIKLTTDVLKQDKPIDSASGMTGVSTGSADRYIFTRIDWHYRRRNDLGSYFILKGHVTDTSGSPGQGRLLVHASLLDSDNTIMAKKTVFAGVVVSEDDLLYRDKAGIEKSLSGKSTSEVKLSGISPSGSLPFMFVFFDLPNNVANFKLTSDRTE